MISVCKDAHEAEGKRPAFGHTFKANLGSLTSLCVRKFELSVVPWPCDKLRCRSSAATMTSSHHQGMSPKATTAMEGETEGPNYGATMIGPPGLSRENQLPAGASVVMNGASEGPRGSTEPQEPMGPLDQHAEPAMPSTSEHTLPELPGVHVRGSGIPQQEPEPTFVHAQQHVEVGGFEFSPPEELPAGSSPGAGIQAMWFMRLQEFVQRRIEPGGCCSDDPVARGPTAVCCSGGFGEHPETAEAFHSGG